MKLEDLQESKKILLENLPVLREHSKEYLWATLHDEAKNGKREDMKLTARQYLVLFRISEAIENTKKHHKPLSRTNSSNWRTPTL